MMEVQCVVYTGPYDGLRFETDSIYTSLYINIPVTLHGPDVIVFATQISPKHFHPSVKHSFAGYDEGGLHIYRPANNR